METGGRSVGGLSGEQGYMQWMPDTWRGRSKDVLGYVAEITPINERYIASMFVEKWLREGKTEEQIFKIWNQGNTGPCVKGINKYKVQYNSCAYVEKAISVLALYN